MKREMASSEVDRKDIDVRNPAAVARAPLIYSVVGFAAMSKLRCGLQTPQGPLLRSLHSSSTYSGF
jgi:hypothetical protein